jgi:predicted enzyme related to lactoylglutathione lyase
MAADWPRPVVHWELVARDPEAQADFYRRMFNWDIGASDLKVVPAGLGAPEPGPAGHILAGTEPGFTLYVQVRDIRASVVLTAELGGKVTAEPFDLPNGPTLAFIQDPEGNRLALVQQ